MTWSIGYHAFQICSAFNMLYLEISLEQDANDEVGSPFPRDIDWRAVCSQEKATSPRSIGFPHIPKYSIIWSADRVTSHRAYRSVMQTVKDLLMARAQSSSLFGFSPRSSSCLSAYIEFNFSFGISTRNITSSFRLARIHGLFYLDCSFPKVNVQHVVDSQRPVCGAGEFSLKSTMMSHPISNDESRQLLNSWQTKDINKRHKHKAHELTRQLATVRYRRQHSPCSL